MNQNPDSIHIPKDIRGDIDSKGFHLYKWISPEEVKLSIERDFLHVMKYLGGPLGIIAILFALINYGDTNKMFKIFFGIIALGSFLIFLYLFILSLKRSFLLSKSAFVILTDSSISFGGKIVKLSEVSSLKKDISHVSETFEEGLFGDSNLKNTKGILKKEVLSQIFGGYKLFFGGNKKNSGINIGKGNESEKAILLIIILYTLYVGVMSFVYFIGVLFLWIFGKIITWVNTKYLVMRGHKVMQINRLFGDIDTLSEDLNHEKKSLKNFLGEAQKNNWKDGLLLEINASIKKISSLGEDATTKVVHLKDTIYSSRYHDMFSFEVYHKWVKTQIIEPLQKIIDLLKKNKKIINENILSIQDQLANPLQSEYSSSLKLQEKRMIIQQDDIEIFIAQLQEMIKRLN